MIKFSKKQWLMIITAIAAIIFSVIIGVITRFSYSDDIQKLPVNNDSIVMFSSSQIPDKNFDLLWDADIIVKAVAEDIGVFTMECTKTQLKVLEVFKGTLTVGEEFVLWQNSRFEYAGLSMDVPIMRASELSNIILPDKEYLIFANQRQSSQTYYEYSEKHSLIPEYISPTRPLYTYEDVVNAASCYYFMYDDTKVGYVADGSNGIYTKYSAVADCEILCQSVEAAKEYEILKAKVMQKIENDYT